MNPETTSGGRSLKFYASIRIETRPGEWTKDGKEVIGQEVKCNIVKNKTFAPYKKATFELMFGEGINKNKEICELLAAIGIVERRGAYYQINDSEGESIHRCLDGELVKMSHQGMENLIEYFEKDTDLFNKAKALIEDDEFDIDTFDFSQWDNSSECSEGEGDDE